MDRFGSTGFRHRWAFAAMVSLLLSASAGSAQAPAAEALALRGEMCGDEMLDRSRGRLSIAYRDQTPNCLETRPIDFDDLLRFAEMASTAYEDDRTLIEAHMGSGFESVMIYLDDHVSKDGGIQILIGEPDDSGVQYVALRGTSNRENVLGDIRFAKRASHRYNLNLHDGFRNYAERAFDVASALLDDSRPVHLTGHSLGGAVVAILDGYLRDAGFEVARVVTFGQPRVTDKYGASVLRLAALDFRFIRVVHEDDMVTLVPKVGYAHYGPEVILKKDRAYCVWPGRNPVNGERVEGPGFVRFWRNLLRFSIGNPADHSMAKYVAKLRDLQDAHISFENEVGTFWGCTTASEPAPAEPTEVQSEGEVADEGEVEVESSPI